MAPATASRSSAPIKFLYPRRKPIRTLANLKIYVHSQSDAHKSHDHKAKSSLYAAPKKFSLPGLRANQAGAISSLIFKQDDFVVMAPSASLGACGEVTCSRSARSAAWFLPRISRIKETIF